MGQKDPLEKGMATYSSILAWEIPWPEDPGGLQSMGRKELDMTQQLTLSLCSHFIISVLLFIRLVGQRGLADCELASQSSGYS